MAILIELLTNDNAQHQQNETLSNKRKFSVVLEVK